MIPWIHPAQRRGARTRAGGRPPITQQVAMPQQINRPQGGNRYMGGSTTTTGPAQVPAGGDSTGGPLAGLLGMKEGYDQVQAGRDTKEKIGNWWEASNGGLSPQERWQDLQSGARDLFTGNSTMTNAEQLYANVDNAYGGFSPQYGNAADATNQFSTGLTGPANNGLFSGTASTGAMQSGGQLGFGPAGTGATQASSGMSSLGNLGSGVDTIGQLGSDLTATSGAAEGLGAGLQTSKAAGDAANASKMGGMGTAAAWAGAGLNAYDMYENGINAGNAMGLAGSAVLIGTANAWNPVGWALLAGSAAYSIFG